ncbi:MAG: hydroxymethylglutaryl-CoA synthase [Candidatus Micrarchaeota archaeon]|nr:hydroxymethylglutaryl-CoA synthase [Candidatus Micrarchaeota archaeon]
MAGIVGYGAYVPRYRITSREIARVWGEDPKRIEEGLGIIEKAIANVDEDTATIGVMSGKNAILRANINPKDIGAVYVGSESHPYIVKSSSSIIAEALNITPELSAADLEFACRAGTSGIIMCMGLTQSGYVKYGMAIGADTAQGKPGDALEYSAGCGGAAFIIGNDNESLATIDSFYSFSTDTPDFWRREGQEFPSHGGRFTGEPAYFRHVISATKGLFEKTGMTIKDFDHVVFHQPNAKFPHAAAKRLGVPPEKLKLGLLCPVIGNTYSGAVPLGLSNILDHAKPGEKILATSFGSGAGSDSFVISVTDKIEEARNRAPSTQSYIDHKAHIDYAMYAKIRGKLKGYMGTG